MRNCTSDCIIPVLPALMYTLPHSLPPCSDVHPPSLTAPLLAPHSLQEALERELDKCSVRRSPLGIDRQGRRYW